MLIYFITPVAQFIYDALQKWNMSGGEHLIDASNLKEGGAQVLHRVKRGTIDDKFV